MEISLMFFGWAWVEIGCPLPLETPPCNFLSALQMRHQPCSNFPISGVECTSGINVWGHQWRCQSLQLPSMAINTNLQPSIPTNNDTRMFSIKFGLCFVFFCSQQIAACPCADQRLTVSFCIWSPTGIPLQPDGSLLLFPAPFPHAAAMPLDLGCAHLTFFHWDVLLVAWSFTTSTLTLVKLGVESVSTWLFVRFSAWNAAWLANCDKRQCFKIW